MTEIWKDCKHYEGLYEVSNYGRVRSVLTGKIKTQNDNGRGYQAVDLWKNGKGKKEYVHRLVALAFIPNPEGKPQVNHKDFDRANNVVWNLEWVTQKENNDWSTEAGRMTNQVKALKEYTDSLQKPIKQYDLNGNLIATYPSLRQAERETGIGASRISAYFKYGYEQCGGYKWRY